MSDEDTPRPGLPGAEEEMDAAKALLNRMREASRARGDAPTGSRSATRGRGKERSTPDQGPADAGRDPLGLDRIFSRLVKERGWSSPVAVGSVIARWSELVGPSVAAHCTPESFENTVLQVRCDSTAWATQLRLLSSSLIARFDKELGPGIVTRLDVIGPVAPNWRKGSRTVRGRGPRDTYG